MQHDIDRNERQLHFDRTVHDMSDKIKIPGNNFNQRCVVHLENDISRCLIGSGGRGGYHAGNEPKVVKKMVRPCITPDRINKRQNGRRFKDDGEESFTLTAVDRHGVLLGGETMAEYRIRKLTPKECWRLMGFEDGDFEKAQDAGISNSQLYKEAGNSIVVDVLFHIYKKLYEAMPYLFDDMRVGSFFSGIGAFEKGLDRLYAGVDGEQ